MGRYPQEPNIWNSKYVFIKYLELRILVLMTVKVRCLFLIAVNFNCGARKAYDKETLYSFNL